MLKIIDNFDTFYGFLILFLIKGILLKGIQKLCVNKNHLQKIFFSEKYCILYKVHPFALMINVHQKQNHLKYDFNEKCKNRLLLEFI